MAAVIPHIRLAVSLCRLKSLKQPRTDRRAGEERRRWPWGFSNSVSSLTPSHQISVSFSLMRQFRPCSSTSFSGSVPLNLSSSSPLAVAPAHYLTRSDASTPHPPPPAPFHPPSFLTCPPSVFHSISVSYCRDPLEVSLCSDKSHEERNKNPSIQQRRGNVVLCLSTSVF